MKDITIGQKLFSKGTACSKKGIDVNEHERLSNITLRYILK
jgi:hypothetical protein